MRARQSNASKLAEIFTPPNATPEERAEIAAWTKKNQGVLATEQRRKAAETAWNAKVVPFGPQHDDGKVPRLTGGQKQYRGRQQNPTEVGAASLRRLPDFARLGPQLGTMRAAEGESWSAVGHTRRAWDQAAFTAGAAVIYERVRTFYGEVRLKFVGVAELDAAVRKWPRYGRKEWIVGYRTHGIGLELAAAMARCAPPSSLRRIVGLAGEAPERHRATARPRPGARAAQKRKIAAGGDRRFDRGQSEGRPCDRRPLDCARLRHRLDDEDRRPPRPGAGGDHLREGASPRWCCRRRGGGDGTDCRSLGTHRRRPCPPGAAPEVDPPLLLRGLSKDAELTALCCLR